jgi:16S rRNA (adenine1518-N6/adenine1519-N6)-dimethyltransferase
MTERLKSRFPSSQNLTVVNEDILSVELNDVRLGAPAPVKVVGNLPYNLTSPILRRLSEWNRWMFACVMVQKEVGDRLCAQPGTADYGALTVGVSLTCTAEKLFDLSEASFDPRPKVKSSVIKLRRREKPLTDDIERTQRVIQAAFQQRRKTILNSLSHGLGLEKDSVQRALDELKLDPELRAERLSPAQFISLTRALL